MKKMPITREGLENLNKQLTHLQRVERPDNIRAISEARSHGDLSENAEYHAAKERQSFLEGKMNELKTAISFAEVIDVETGPTDRVVFGRTVLLYDLNAEKEISYQLVGPYESSPENGKISVKSPLGQGLIGQEIGDEVKIKTPGGIEEFEILEIS
ncbi:MAG TPA: transcription elongation factor GreA [Deltaproteobacteria bacterium]|nr:transcription elongation factor GreA [Deltaproteobacteria bacterium]HIJ35987.1 transcription elongation factor GreA [Deltaproteobacteria bacterium]HIJ41245.1 transcription elongation factor GreA [Deltaproteobacteria bacterium]